MESVNPNRLQADASASPYPSAAYRSMHDWVQRVALADLPVLIQGESGSGKEGVARNLHRLSRRRGGPQVAVNCAALTESLLEAELFGAERGAYTGADRDRPGLFRRADGGTLFLDEVGDMSPAMQAKLLRALEQGKIRPVGGAREIDVEVRVIAATHRDLPRLVAREAFRADLYYRLAVLQVHVPPLRERLEDLPRLVRELEPRLMRQTRQGALRISDDGWRAIRGYAWPGNVRELHARLARGLLRSAGGEVRARHLELEASVPWQVTEDGGADPDSGVGLERRMIESALRRASGSVALAATRIGWSRQKLYRRIKVLEVPRPRGR